MLCEAAGEKRGRGGGGGPAAAAVAAAAATAATVAAASGKAVGASHDNPTPDVPAPPAAGRDEHANSRCSSRKLTGICCPQPGHSAYVARGTLGAARLPPVACGRRPEGWLGRLFFALAVLCDGPAPRGREDEGGPQRLK